MSHHLPQARLQGSRRTCRGYLHAALSTHIIALSQEASRWARSPSALLRSVKMRLPLAAAAEAMLAADTGAERSPSPRVIEIHPGPKGSEGTTMDETDTWAAEVPAAAPKFHALFVALEKETLACVAGLPAWRVVAVAETGGAGGGAGRSDGGGGKRSGAASPVGRTHGDDGDQVGEEGAKKEGKADPGRVEAGTPGKGGSAARRQSGGAESGDEDREGAGYNTGEESDHDGVADDESGRHDEKDNVERKPRQQGGDVDGERRKDGGEPGDGGGKGKRKADVSMNAPPTEEDDPLTAGQQLFRDFVRTFEDVLRELCSAKSPLLEREGGESDATSEEDEENPFGVFWCECSVIGLSPRCCFLSEPL